MSEPGNFSPRDILCLIDKIENEGFIVGFGLFARSFFHNLGGVIPGNFVCLANLQSNYKKQLPFCQEGLRLILIASEY